MTPFHPLTRRSFLKATGIGLGSVALDALLSRDLAAAEKYRGLPGFPHHPPRAKRVIFLYMSGGPSHLETFDYKPALDKLDGQPMPESFTKGQPIAQLQGQKLKVQGHRAKFKNHGNAGRNPQPISQRMWDTGFLPSRFQGVEFNSAGDPVYYLRNPAGVSAAQQRDLVAAVGDLDRHRNAAARNPEVETRIAQYEMAFKMQA